jgi:hypothetical protein
MHLDPPDIIISQKPANREAGAQRFDDALKLGHNDTGRGTFASNNEDVKLGLHNDEAGRGVRVAYGDGLEICKMAS